MASNLGVFGLDLIFLLAVLPPPLPLRLFPSHYTLPSHGYKCCLQSKLSMPAETYSPFFPRVFRVPCSHSLSAASYIQKSLMPLQAAQAAFLREYKLVVVGGGGELVYNGL